MSDSLGKSPTGPNELGVLVHQIVEGVAAKMIEHQKSEDRLWKPSDIANHLQLAEQTVRCHIINKPDFPRPKLLGTGGKRWVPEEVKVWAKRK